MAWSRLSQLRAGEEMACSWRPGPSSSSPFTSGAAPTGAVRMDCLGGTCQGCDLLGKLAPRWSGAGNPFGANHLEEGGAEAASSGWLEALSFCRDSSSRYRGSVFGSWEWLGIKVWCLPPRKSPVLHGTSARSEGHSAPVTLDSSPSGALYLLSRMVYVHQSPRRENHVRSWVSNRCGLLWAVLFKVRVVTYLKVV